MIIKNNTVSSSLHRFFHQSVSGVLTLVDQFRSIPDLLTDVIVPADMREHAPYILIDNAVRNSAGKRFFLCPVNPDGTLAADSVSFADSRIDWDMIEKCDQLADVTESEIRKFENNRNYFRTLHPVQKAYRSTRKLLY